MLKKLFFLLTFCTIFLHAQDTLNLAIKDSTKCPPGNKWHWGMATTGMVVQSGCYTDSAWKSALLSFDKYVCNETGLGVYYGGEGSLSYSNIHSWNDTVGCTSKESWYQFRHEKFVSISKWDYDSIMVDQGRYVDYTITWFDAKNTRHDSIIYRPLARKKMYDSETIMKKSF